MLQGKVTAPAYTERVIDPLSQDDVKRILTACERQTEKTQYSKRVANKRSTALRDKAIVLTLLDTGLRASELTALVIADYDQGRGRLHVRHGKGDKERFAVMGNRSRRTVWRYLATRDNAKAHDPLFATNTGRHIDRSALHQLLNRAGDRGGVHGVHPHRFRHTFAVQFLRSGGNVLVLRELMGHESLEQTMRYVRFVESDIDGANRYSPADGWKL